MTQEQDYRCGKADEGCTLTKFPEPYGSQSSPFQDTDYDHRIKEAFETNREIRKGVRIAKVVLVGESAVGKTCLVNRFCHKVFDYEHKGTIGVDFGVKRFEIMNIRFNMQLWDTAGQERFRSIASSYYRGAHAIVLVFDFKRHNTMLAVTDWLKETLQHSEDPLLFLVGTKKDLVNPAVFQIYEKEALKMAASMKAEFWPVSSLTGENIQKFFNRVAVLTFCKSIKKELEVDATYKKADTSLKVTREAHPKKKGCKSFCSSSV